MTVLINKKKYCISKKNGNNLIEFSFYDNELKVYTDCTQEKLLEEFILRFFEKYYSSYDFKNLFIIIQITNRNNETFYVNMLDIKNNTIYFIKKFDEYDEALNFVKVSTTTRNDIDGFIYADFNEISPVSIISVYLTKNNFKEERIHEFELKDLENFKFTHSINTFKIIKYFFLHTIFIVVIIISSIVPFYIKIIQPEKINYSELRKLKKVENKLIENNLFLKRLKKEIEGKITFNKNYIKNLKKEKTDKEIKKLLEKIKE